jgi:hypothetical protein
MKQSILGLSILGLLLLAPSVSSACIQKLVPDKETVKIGDQVKVTSSVKWIHDKCLLDIDDINYEYKGVVKVSQTKWKKVGKGKFESVITLKITGKNAEIKSWRKCSRAGRHGTELKFKFEAPKASPKP